MAVPGLVRPTLPLVLPKLKKPLQVSPEEAFESDLQEPCPALAAQASRPAAYA
jgi:hypothetical protein